MPRLLVTGGSGFLGRRVVAHARGLGWDVVATTFRSPPGDGVRLDLADPDAVEAAVVRVAPDAVVHTAYDKDGERAWQVIVDGSAAVARATARLGARLVHVSSDLVFAGDAGRPYVEVDPADATTGYGLAKAVAEREVRAACREAVVARTSLIIGGPGRDPSPHERAVADPSAVFWTDSLRCPVQVDDLAAALLELAVLDVSGPIHVAGPDELTRWELASLVAGRPVPGAAAPAGVPRDCRLDTSLARRTLKARLRGMREVFGTSSQM